MNKADDANTLATQCPKCCGTGNIIYWGAPSIVCIDCGGGGRVNTKRRDSGGRSAEIERLTAPRSGHQTGVGICQSTKKDSYPDSDSAKAAAAILNQKPGRRLSTYRCRACDLWHIRRDRDANP